MGLKILILIMLSTALAQESGVDDSGRVVEWLIGDAMVYRVQQLACSGVTYRFTCNEPNNAIKIGRGMNWGVMTNLTSPLEGEQCKYSIDDCYVHQTNNSFLDTLIGNCEDKNTCTFYIPVEVLPECGYQQSNYAFLLINCAAGMAVGGELPENLPSGIVAVNVSGVSNNGAFTNSLNSNFTTSSHAKSIGSTHANGLDSLTITTTPKPPTLSVTAGPQAPTVFPKSSTRDPNQESVTSIPGLTSPTKVYPERDPLNDTIMYKVQAAYCSGKPQLFVCDKPDHVIWVGKGLIWGAKRQPFNVSDTCFPREGDCKYYEKENLFLETIQNRCNYQPYCWFTVPKFELPGCNKTNDWVFLLFQCGVTMNWRPPLLEMPSPDYFTTPSLPDTTSATIANSKATTGPPNDNLSTQRAASSTAVSSASAETNLPTISTGLSSGTAATPTSSTSSAGTATPLTGSRAPSGESTVSLTETAASSSISITILTGAAAPTTGSTDISTRDNTLLPVLTTLSTGSQVSGTGPSTTVTKNVTDSPTEKATGETAPDSSSTIITTMTASSNSSVSQPRSSSPAQTPSSAATALSSSFTTLSTYSYPNRTVSTVVVGASQGSTTPVSRVASGTTAISHSSIITTANVTQITTIGSDVSTLSSETSTLTALTPSIDDQSTVPHSNPIASSEQTTISVSTSLSTVSGISSTTSPGSGGSVTPDSSSPTLPDSSSPTSTDSSVPASPDSSIPTSPDSSNTVTPDSNSPVTPDNNGSTLPDSSGPTSPDSSVPASPDSSVPTLPDSSNPVTPDSSNPVAPDSSSPVTPDSSGSTLSDSVSTLSDSSVIVSSGTSSTMLPNTSRTISPVSNGLTSPSSSGITSLGSSGITSPGSSGANPVSPDSSTTRSPGSSNTLSSSSSGSVSPDVSSVSMDSSNTVSLDSSGGSSPGSNTITSPSVSSRTDLTTRLGQSPSFSTASSNRPLSTVGNNDSTASQQSDGTSNRPTGAVNPSTSLSSNNTGSTIAVVTSTIPSTLLSTDSTVSESTAAGSVTTNITVTPSSSASQSFTSGGGQSSITGVGTTSPIQTDSTILPSVGATAALTVDLPMWVYVLFAVFGLTVFLLIVALLFICYWNKYKRNIYKLEIRRLQNVDNTETPRDMETPRDLETSRDTERLA